MGWGTPFSLGHRGGEGGGGGRVKQEDFFLDIERDEELLVSIERGKRDERKSIDWERLKNYKYMLGDEENV